MVRLKVRSHSKICIILLCYYFGTLCLSFKGKALAEERPPENRADQHQPGLPAADLSDARVRIGLRLIPYGSSECKNTPCQPGQTASPGRVVRYTLRAHVTKPNHFFFQGFHIETTPLSWNKKTNTYAIKLNIAKLYGQQGEVEERLGELNLQGNLVGDGGVYVLHGASAKQFKNKFAQPILDIVAGYKPANAPAQLSNYRSPGNLPRHSESPNTRRHNAAANPPAPSPSPAFNRF